ncbi:MAG TPA: hypothetical protein VK533_01665 [Sphingomonas sp.]|uniref:hypothetical protein n=1 Tax=Sphingomonas sp. TaxID=28214 RepID=UPI002B59A795|nr:hypothetical protein [Sphingomonas sp.]HMI18230.1 hypothetical protein [Sphingomonas sp.]
MRWGAMILFLLAIFVAIVSFATFAVGFPGFDQASGVLPEHPQPLAHVWWLVTGAVSALHTAAMPFFGALVINRLDRWRENRA